MKYEVTNKNFSFYINFLYACTFKQNTISELSILFQLEMYYYN